MDDSEFIRVTTRVIVVGLIIVGSGAAALLYAFRKLGDAGESRDFKPFVTLVGAAIFILVFCLVLLRWSFAGR